MLLFCINTVEAAPARTSQLEAASNSTVVEVVGPESRALETAAEPETDTLEAAGLETVAAQIGVGVALVRALQRLVDRQKERQTSWLPQFGDCG